MAPNYPVNLICAGESYIDKQEALESLMLQEYFTFGRYL